ncbi:MAG: apolipoprotein N-acyltransferase [Bacteroidetes bacterium]|nr:apolipoprotein N-acyltransferase [Bacteroidota bacterium]
MPFTKNKYFPLLLALDSGLVLWLGWPVWPLAFLLFFGFVSILLLDEHFSNSDVKKPGLKFFIYTYIALLIWNTLTTWWVCYSTVGGGIIAIIFNSLLMSVPFLLFRFTKKVTGLKLGYLSFILYWLGFEYLHLNWDLSWPWLTLGNGFAMFPEWVQWYEYTGVLGGSLWLLIVNLLLFFGLRSVIFEERFEWKKFIIPVLLIIIPVVFSYYKRAGYKEKGDSVNVVLVQPNIDPYNEKFSGSPRFIPYQKQLDHLITLSETKLDSTIDYLVWPETAMPSGYWEDEISDYPMIQSLIGFLEKYPNLTLITGADTYIEYDSEQNASETARFKPDLGYYDVYNTAMQINPGGEISFYHKSKLVPGVEKMPYPEFFKFLEPLSIDMGGTTGSLGKQKERTVFKKSQIPNPKSQIAIAPAICYESIYGEFMTEYVLNGADFIFIITNDGWWKDTPGYKQHLNYATLRAIETKRSIARSANTGISCFINQKGDILQATGWWRQAVIKGTIISNDKMTFYTTYGDYIGRIAAFLAVAIFLSVIVKYITTIRKT